MLKLCAVTHLAEVLTLMLPGQAPPPPPAFPGPPEALQHMQYSQAPPPQPSSQVHSSHTLFILTSLC